MFHLVSIGVNDAPNAGPLNFAEKDAQDVYEAFTGGEGPVRSANARLLQGDDATLRIVRRELNKISRARPRFFVFYFSGHGSPNSLALSDEGFRFSELYNAIEKIRAERTIVILDSCHAAGYAKYTPGGPIRLGGIPTRSWLDLLAEATPGTRLMFAVGEDRLSSENGAIQNGVFTHALLRGLRHATPDLTHEGESYVSERRAFFYALRHIRDIQRDDQVPQARGLVGDFPLFRPQTVNDIGEGWISRAMIGTEELHLTIYTNGRKFVPTRLAFQVFLSNGRLLHEGDVFLTPQFDASVWRPSIPIDLSWFESDPDSWFMLQRIRRFRHAKLHFYWILKLLDAGGRSLDSERVDSCLCKGS